MREAGTTSVAVTATAVATAAVAAIATLGPSASVAPRAEDKGVDYEAEEGNERSPPVSTSPQITPDELHLDETPGSESSDSDSEPPLEGATSPDRSAYEAFEALSPEEKDAATSRVEATLLVFLICPHPTTNWRPSSMSSRRKESPNGKKRHLLAVQRRIPSWPRNRARDRALARARLDQARPLRQGTHV